MGKVLNNISPRATACCDEAVLPVAAAQLVYKLNALGVERRPRT